MFRLKGCGRCGGDLWFGRDFDGAGWRCLQCGRQATRPAPVAAASREWTSRFFGGQRGCVRRTAR
ncbi:MAG: hypothetical protein KatS3mg060_1098 [Dehalococcoidia bacterium]|nr:MAG: hypothetical protein KatS3mg060_1098 [Dehalococcoidia bacterium]